MFTGYMKLEDKLRNHIAVHPNAQKFPDSYGVEIELEGKNVAQAGPDLVGKLWVAHADHSLRNHNGGQSIEYVFQAPLDIVKTTEAIDKMFAFLTGPGVKVHESYRTSIHVHVNFADETFRTIYNYMTLSLILDELLVSQNGDHRIGNNFCLRAKDAMGQTDSLIKSVQHGSEFFGLDQNGRYSSINFASLMKFGSIEFRSLECTTHKGRLMHWINTLAHMKKAAKAFKDPTEIISMFSKMNAQDFLHAILGPYAIKYATVPGMERMLTNGMRIAQDFAYCSEWKSNANKGDPNLKEEMGQKKMKQMKAMYGGINDWPYVAPDVGLGIQHPGVVLNWDNGGQVQPAQVQPAGAQGIQPVDWFDGVNVVQPAVPMPAHWGEDDGPDA